jgi:chemotaxis protein MotA
MFVVIGIAVVIIGVAAGFMMEGGPILILMQWVEFLIIGSAAIGSLLVGTPIPILKKLLGVVPRLLKGSGINKREYINLLKTMFELFSIAQRDGLINIEPHIEDPAKSSVFSKNPFLLKNHHALYFFTDTMKLLLGGGVPPYDLEAMLEADLESHHAEEAHAPALIQKMGDALPGLGIVAAVLGIVITMQAIDGPPAEIGHKVAVALVGTFVGILASYGFVQPAATHLELLSQIEGRYLECIKAGVIAYSKGNSPIVVVEFARRTIFSNDRPTFSEVEKAMRESRSAPK